MKVHIKQFDVSMLVKSKGIEFEVRKPDGSSQIGDCHVTMTGLIWCKGKTAKKNGIKISWDDLATVLDSAATKKVAVKAAKDE